MIHLSICRNSTAFWGASYQNRTTHRIRPNFNKVPTTAFVIGDEAVWDNSLRNLSTKSISVYEALRAALATDHFLINCILSMGCVEAEIIDWRRLISETDDGTLAGVLNILSGCKSLLTIHCH